MRYMCLTQVFLYTCQRHNLKSNESKKRGWIKFIKEGSPGIYFYHEAKITWKVGGENYESLSSCLENSWLNE